MSWWEDVETEVELVAIQAQVLVDRGWEPWRAIKAAVYVWERVDRADECWLWTGPDGARGYGQVTFEYQKHRAHRYVLILTEGDRPGLNALHGCDTRRCVRPNATHVRWGTQQENIQEMVSRGRHWMHIDPDRAREVAMRNLPGALDV